MAKFPPQIGDSTFGGVKKIITLFVHCDSVSKYKVTDYWNKFKNIQEYCSTDGFENDNDNGLSDIVENIDFSIYPNIANKKVRLGLNNIDKANVIIVNMQGKLVKTLEVNGENEITIDVSQFVKGTYIVTIQTNKTRINKKLILQ